MLLKIIMTRISVIRAILITMEIDDKSSLQNGNDYEFKLFKFTSFELMNCNYN